MVMSITLHVMCARKLSSKDVKIENVTLDDLVHDPGADDEFTVRALRAHMSWSEWLRNDFFRYWYVVGVLTLDVFLVLELGRSFNVHDSTGIILLIIVFSIILISAYFLFRRLWPEGILTGLFDQSDLKTRK